jgi:hypothetical protein
MMICVPGASYRSISQRARETIGPRLPALLCLGLSLALAGPGPALATTISVTGPSLRRAKRGPAHHRQEQRYGQRG